MSEYISLAITILVVVIAAGFIGYTVYRKYIAGNPVFGGSKVTDMLKVLKVCMEGIDYFIDELQETVQDLGGISREAYENDTEYHNALIDAAITIVEKRASEAGFTFKLNHNALVSLSELVVGYIVRTLEDKESEKVIEESVEEIPLHDGVDITKELDSFYKE